MAASSCVADGCDTPGGVGDLPVTAVFAVICDCGGLGSGGCGWRRGTVRRGASAEEPLARALQVIDQQSARIDELTRQNTELRELVAGQADQLAEVNATIAVLQRMLFGRSSEKSGPAPGGDGGDDAGPGDGGKPGSGKKKQARRGPGARSGRRDYPGAAAVRGVQGLPRRRVLLGDAVVDRARGRRRAGRYQLKRKDGPDADGYQRLSCPAAARGSGQRPAASGIAVPATARTCPTAAPPGTPATPLCATPPKASTATPKTPPTRPSPPQPAAASAASPPAPCSPPCC